MLHRRGYGDQIGRTHIAQNIELAIGGEGRLELGEPVQPVSPVLPQFCADGGALARTGSGDGECPHREQLGLLGTRYLCDPAEIGMKKNRYFSIPKTLYTLGLLALVGCERNVPPQQGVGGAPNSMAGTASGGQVNNAGTSTGGMSGGNPFGQVGDQEDVGKGGAGPSGGAGNPDNMGGGAGAPNMMPVEPTVDVAMMCASENYADPTSPGETFPYDTIEAKVTAKLGAMTGAEKAEMMGGEQVCPGYWCSGDRNAQFSTRDTAGVAAFKFRDGPRGISQWEEENNAGRKATAFPVSVARAASFDLGLEYEVGAAICKEVLAAGWNNTLAPTVNLTKHPAAGRAQESYGEDPWLTGKFGTAFVVGCQQFTQACPKHFVGNEVETGRVNVSADMNDRTLRENYARPFEMIIKGADPACIMASYNAVNGTHVTENPALLKDLLRTKLGFKGFVLSDWGAAVSGAPSVNAGLEVEMPERVYFDGIESQVDAATLDGAVRHILTQKYRFGFTESWQQCCDDTEQVKGVRTYFNNNTYLEHPDHVALAERAAEEGTVLLKNDDALLPITPEKYTTVALLAPPMPGPCPKPVNGAQTNCPKGEVSFWDDWEYQNGAGTWANAARMGDKGSSQVFPSERISPVQGLVERAPAGINLVEGTDPAAAAGADLAIVFAALTSFDEGEEWQNGGDRETLELPDGQADFIAQVAAQGKPTLVVLYGGAPITMAGWKDQVKGIVMAWYPGMVGAYGVADLLYGTTNFSGRLPQTWPVAIADAGDVGSGVPRFTFQYFHGYRDFEARGVAPLFPFGYGLSYTTFSYNSLTLPCGTTAKDGVVRAAVDISNTGSVAGTEVIQVYVGFPSGPDSPLQRPKKEYKVAVRVDLEAGATKRVTIPLPVKDWAYFDETVDDWVVETGEHTIMVGPNSRDIPANMIGTVSVQ